MAQSLLREFSQTRREIRRRKKPLWDGVYGSYSDVPCTGRGFDDDYWVEETYRMTADLLKLQSLGDFPEGAIEDHMLLPATLATLQNDTGETSVLDFGGGMGISYITILRSMAQELSLRYKIVECERVCELGTKLFADDENISFSATLPESSEQVDLVYLCGVLQYIEDYQGVLKRFTEYRPKAILMSKTSTGDVPTYATAQINVPGSSLPYWVVNIDELIDLMASNGYKLGSQGVMPRMLCQDNLPEQYRFGLTRNLLFLRQ